MSDNQSRYVIKMYTDHILPSSRMAAFNVTQLQELGYDEETDFSDPEDPRWSAVSFNQADFKGRAGPFTPQSITSRISELALQQPYSEQEAVEAALAAAWTDGSAQKRDARRKVNAGGDASISRVRRFAV